MRISFIHNGGKGKISNITKRIISGTLCIRGYNTDQLHPANERRRAADWTEPHYLFDMYNPWISRLYPCFRTSFDSPFVENDKVKKIKTEYWTRRKKQDILTITN